MTVKRLVGCLDIARRLHYRPTLKMSCILKFNSSGGGVIQPWEGSETWQALASYLGVLLGVSQLGIAAAAVISVSFQPRILLTASTH